MNWRRCLPGFALAFLALPSSLWAVDVQEEVKVGREVMEEVRPLGLTSDPALDEIGQRLSGVVQRKDLPWRFWVIEDWRTYNAFAAPGGFVFITRTYYEKLNDDEAAFVIGHEMAHVDLDHYKRNVKRYHEANLGHLLLNILVKGEAGGAWRTATDIGATAYMTHFSRALEKEADLTGYHLAEAAGYDAREAVTALSKLGEQPEVHPWIVNLYGTHPLISSREDRLAALGGEEPQDMPTPEPSPRHQRDLTQGLEPFAPKLPIAVRILAPDGKRWEDSWRKNFTRHLHLRLTPLGFVIAGDDLMYKPDIGDPVEAARSRDAKYLLLVTVNEMSTAETGSAELRGTPVRSVVDVSARLISVADGVHAWEAGFSRQQECRDILTADREILYTDTCVGALAEQVAGELALAAAKAAGAKPAEPRPAAATTDERQPE
jgi:Zn-dependent protease with chaperone function